MAEKILFVDDEPAVLDGYRRMLHREFPVDTAIGGTAGLAAIEEKGPYAVVVSDMRMPGMSGSQFLAEVRRRAPDTVRMLLTGYTDLNAAMDAVNHGNIFRFLTKPCEKDVLVNALALGNEQYRLVAAERELLEKTLMGSVQVLSDVLSAASPEAFGRSQRIANYVRHMMRKFSVGSPWRIEVAAILSQLGCVTLDTDLLQQAYAGEKLTPEAQARFNEHPAAAARLLAHIPRLEPIAWMIGQQFVAEVPPLAPGLPDASAREVAMGAKMLKLATAYEELRVTLPADADVFARMRVRAAEFGRELIDALADFKHDAAVKELRRLTIPKLRPGMVLNQEIRNRQGMLLVGHGQEITNALLMKLENFHRAGTIDKEVSAFVPA